MREVLFAFLIFIAGGLSGYFYKTCPVPKSPEPVIKEVEKIRTIEKPVIKEVTKDIRNKVKVGMKEHRIAKISMMII